MMTQIPSSELDERFISHERPFSQQITALYPGPCRNWGVGGGRPVNGFINREEMSSLTPSSPAEKDSLSGRLGGTKPATCVFVCVLAGAGGDNW